MVFREPTTPMPQLTVSLQPVVFGLAFVLWPGPTRLEHGRVVCSQRLLCGLFQLPHNRFKHVNGKRRNLRPLLRPGTRVYISRQIIGVRLKPRQVVLVSYVRRQDVGRGRGGQVRPLKIGGVCGSGEKRSVGVGKAGDCRTCNLANRRQLKGGQSYNNSQGISLARHPFA